MAYLIADRLVLRRRVATGVVSTVDLPADVEWLMAWSMLFEDAVTVLASFVEFAA